MQEHRLHTVTFRLFGALKTGTSVWIMQPDTPAPTLPLQAHSPASKMSATPVQAALSERKDKVLKTVSHTIL